MLTDLLGNKNVERILFFLLVNESCYAHEMQKTLGISLSPLQNAFLKLEKASVLTSDMRGKTKMYRFNPTYPLLEELQALLKKAFIHLPAQEKRLLFSRKEEWRLSSKDQFRRQKQTALCLDAFWKRLARAQNVSIQVQSQSFDIPGETKYARGEVVVKEEDTNTLVFTEKGHWTHQNFKELDFSNALRWTLDRSAGLIGLEHLRYGHNHPVFLFHLAPTSPKSLQSIDSHLCLNDCYFGRIDFAEQHIRFLWRILGPRKNEALNYTYF